MTETQAKYLISTFYKFVPMTDDEASELKSTLESFVSETSIKGLFLLGREGINTTISGTPKDIRRFKDFLVNDTPIGELVFKDSYSHRIPFRLMKFQIRDEIVTIGDTTVVPDETAAETHLPPEEWHRAIEEGKGTFIDTRNWYETEIGTFKGAHTIPLEKFSEFADEAEKLAPNKEEPLYMFCTGGIRCEKAVPEMKRRGYKKVYQLEGGILNYFQKFPDGYWDGECFVFDHRVAVDTHLQPSKQYSLCPHCGQPAKKVIDCLRCNESAKVCDKCLDAAEKFHTCSKNCAHHFERGSQVRVKKQSTNRQLWNK